MNAGCVPLLIQMPIIFGLVAVIYKPLTYALQIPEDVVTTLIEGLKKIDVTYTSRTAELVVIEHFKSLSGLVAEKYANQIRNFDFTFFGLPLGQTPSYTNPSVLWTVPILSGLSSLASSIYMNINQKRNNPEMGKNPATGCMTIFMPLLSLFFTFQFPIGIGIYWIASNVFAFIQQVILGFTHNPRKMVARLMVEETIQRRSKENNRKLVIQKQRNS
jgi:YidC/Oxa1 family membrane protein insertase